METIGGGISRTTFGGLATGIDTGLLIESLINIERRPLRLLEGRRDSLSDQQSLFRDFNTTLLGLRDAARGLDNFSTTLSGASVDEEFLAFGATSTDDKIVGVTANGDATSGSYSVRVENLATVAREFTQTFSSSSSTIASSGETLTLNFGSGDSRNFTVTVGASGVSLESLRDQINTDSNNGGNVQAEVLFDGANHRLVLSGGKTGVKNDFSISGTGAALGAVGFVDSSLSQNAVDASIKVLGITVTSPSNTVKNALPGLTLELTGVSSATDTTDDETVSVTLDEEGIETKLQTMVDSFNSATDFFDDQFNFNTVSETAGPLSNDSLLRSMQRSLQTIATNQYLFSANPYTSLADIGVSFGSDGRLSIDSDDLKEALGNNALAVRQLLSGDGTKDGAATAFSRAIEPLVRFGDGTLAIRDQSFVRQIDSLNEQIERFERRLQGREETLLARFSRLEASVSLLQIQSQIFGIGR